MGFVSADTGATDQVALVPSEATRKATSRRPLPHRESPRTIASTLRSNRPTASNPDVYSAEDLNAEGSMSAGESGLFESEATAIHAPKSESAAGGELAAALAPMDEMLVAARARIAELERAHGEALRQLEAQAEAEASQAADQTASQARAEQLVADLLDVRTELDAANARCASREEEAEALRQQLRQATREVSTASERELLTLRGVEPQGTRGPRPEGRDPPARPEAA